MYIYTTDGNMFLSGLPTCRELMSEPKVAIA